MFYNYRKNKKAFTLVELIVVIAIIAILGAVTGVFVYKYIDSSRESTAKTSLNNAKTSFVMFLSDNDGGKTFKEYCNKFVENIGNFYISDDTKLTKKSFSNTDSFTIYYHSDSTGSYWSECTFDGNTFSDVVAKDKEPSKKYAIKA